MCLLHCQKLTFHIKDLIYLMSIIGVKHQKNSKDTWVKPVVENNQIALNAIKKGLLPDFNGMTAKDAVFLIESLDCSSNKRIWASELSINCC